MFPIFEQTKILSMIGNLSIVVIFLECQEVIEVVETHNIIQNRAFEVQKMVISKNIFHFRNTSRITRVQIF